MLRTVNAWFEANRWAGDAVIAGALLVLLVPASLGVGSTYPVGALLSVLLVLPQFFRRTFPRAVLVGTGALCLLQLAVTNDPVPGDVVIPMVVFSTAAYVADRVWGIAALLMASVGSGLAAVVWTWSQGAYYRTAYGQVLFLFLAGLAVVAAAYLAGIRHRDRREHTAEQLAALAERNRLLSAERDSRSEAAAGAERARIARELHDIVAHSLSVIVVQADGGAAAVATKPELAPEVLQTIAATSRDALNQMRRMVAVLRSPAGDDGAGYAPAPGPGDFDDLIEQVRSTGLPVAVETIGTVRPMSPDAGLTAFRAVQESLTNVLKHAGPAASVQVVLHYGPRELVVTVTDDGRGAATEIGEAGPGHGLEGMRERVQLAGGSVQAGPRVGGGFEVGATIPYGTVEGGRLAADTTTEGESLA